MKVANLLAMVEKELKALGRTLLDEGEDFTESAIETLQLAEHTRNLRRDFTGNCVGELEYSPIELQTKER